MARNNLQSKAAPQRHRPPYRAARAFYLTLFIGVCLATFALLATPQLRQKPVYHALQKKSEAGTLDGDETCRLVHSADDQCAFVKAHCLNEEAGFSAYLHLYFCKLPHVKAVAFIILISWLGLLFSTIGIAASDFFCINLSTIATILGMSESMAGVTFLAFGNGSPDVFSTFAAMSTNSGSLAIGELFGAAGFITAVVAGSMALIRPFHVARKSFIRDVGFFVVAAAFSLVFLWDGKLLFWECVAMVGFYIFYVAFVVAWHWWLARRRRRREREAAMRGHFVPPEDEYDAEHDEYHDDPEERGTRPSVSRGTSGEDWSALESGGDGLHDDNDEDDDEAGRDRWMSELNSNMRLTRFVRDRRNTLVPVRPSLVGALEFQAVLKSLHKSRNIQTYPLNARRYSDDPTWTTAQEQENMSTYSDPAARPPYEFTNHPDATPTMERPTLDVPYSAPVRGRAVSANDAESLRIGPAIRHPSQGSFRTTGGPSSRHASKMATPSNGISDTLEVPRSAKFPQPNSPSIEISPSTPHRQSFMSSGPSMRTASPDHLAPPSEILTTAQSPGDITGEIPVQHMNDAHNAATKVPSSRQLPKIIIPRGESSRSSTPKTSPFPKYRDDQSPFSSRPPSLYLPPASIASPESVPASQTVEPGITRRPTTLTKFWPHMILPAPGVLVSTLFPTIYLWGEKNYWEKALGIIAAPSVLLLTITLPVVESNTGNDSEFPVKDRSFDSARSKPTDSAPVNKTLGNVLVREEGTDRQHRQGSIAITGAAGHGTSATVATNIERDQHHNHGEDVSADSNLVQDFTKSPMPLPTDDENKTPSPEPWNRWLLIVQLFLAPLFIVFAIYSQSPTDIDSTWLIKPILICLLVSLVLLIVLLLTTTANYKPSVYKHILSLVGFIVSIAWISTIAAQVVGALKALAVILNMSHAIMGLTIFAVGNSLGDLVADVTVAKLGYPVMALSACFGGPMLNILLGVGLSGSYILIRGAEKRVRKHPGKDFKFKSYHIDVSNTLLISGATLLITLVGLLIFVPMNKWVFSKRIGWVLIAVWVLSTIGNVALELTGWADR